MTYEDQFVMLIRSLAADLQLIGVDPQLRQVETRLALELVAPFDEINRQGRQTWGEALEGFDCQALENILRGLTIAECHHGWCGGSVAAVIWVYSLFRSHCSNCRERSDDVADWILRNSTNPYEPFGSSYYGPRTLSQYRVYETERQRRKRLTEAQQLEVEKKQREAKIRREAEKVEVARTHHANKIRRELARGFFLSTIARLPPQRLFERLLDDDLEFPIDALPAGMIPLDPQILAQLNASTRRHLLQKIDLRPGAWRTVRKCLEALDPPSEGDRS